MFAASVTSVPPSLTISTPSIVSTFPITPASETKSVVTKIASYNINGLQGIVKKEVTAKGIVKQTKAVKNNCLDIFIAKEKPDILCLQEIRCSAKFEWKPHPSTGLVHVYVSHSTDKSGYSGTLTASKTKPLSVTYGLLGTDGKASAEIKEREGRVITLEFKDYFLVNVYTPNSGRSGERLVYRTQVWEPAFRRHVAHLGNTKKFVIVIGDLNCMPQDLDTSFPAYRKLAGSSPEEKKCFATLLSGDGGGHPMLDTFRSLHLTERKYSWGYPGGKSTGCRLDFCLMSAAHRDKLLSSDILTQYEGSDHFPITVSFNDRT